MKKRILSIALSMVMLMSLFPATALASEADGPVLGSSQVQDGGEQDAVCDECGQANGVHLESCSNYIEPEEGGSQVLPECGCGAEDGIHAEDCPLYEAPAAPQVDEAVEQTRLLIDALPSVEKLSEMPLDEQGEYYNLTLAANEAYQALSDEQKAQLTEENGKLDELFAYFASPQLTVPAADGTNEHSHCVCGDGDCTAHGGDVTFLPLSRILGEPDLSGRYEGATIAQAGNYYLDQDISLYDGLIIAADVSLCLNGHTLTYRGTYEGVTVKDGAELNICDCSDDESGMIDTYELQANTVAVRYGTVNLYSGTLRSEGSIALRGYVEGGNYTVNQYGGTAWGDSTEDAVSIEGDDNASAVYNLYGGTVKTTSRSAGGAISVMDNAELFISGAPEISNVSTWEYASDIYTETPIHIAGALTANAPQYSVRYSPGGGDIFTGIFTDGWPTYMANADHKDYFVSADPEFSVLRDASGELKIDVPPHSHCVCGGSNSVGGHTHDTDAPTWTAWDGGTITYTNNIAYVYLAQDVQLSDVLKVTAGKTLNLCLNGHVLSQGATNKPVILTYGTANLNICDCTSTTHAGYIDPTTKLWTEGTYTGSEENVASVTLTGGVITGGNNSSYSGGGISLSDNTGTMNLYGGNVAGNSSTYLYGGGGIGGKSTINIYGGSVTGNNASVNDSNLIDNSNFGGGGIHSNGGTLNLYAGSIAYNTTNGNGGGLCSDNATCVLAGGSITRNTAINGGGVKVCRGTTTLSGTDIKNNSATSGGGGGIHAEGNGIGRITLTITGGSIAENTAATNGGGMYLDEFGTCTMSAGSFSRNTAGNNGGGVYVYGPSNNRDISMTVTGGSITENTADQNGGGVFVTGNATFSLSDAGKITNNSAQYHGGGIHIEVSTYGTTLNISGGTVSGNSVTNNTGSGGGVYYFNGTVNLSGAPTITDNKVGANPNNLFISQNMKVTISGELANSEKIGVTMYQGTGTFAQPDGSTVTSLATGYKDYFFSDDNAYAVAVDGDNLKLAAAFTVSFNSGGGTGTMDAVSVVQGGTYTLPTTCTFTAPTGKQFKGWAASADGEVISTDTITVNQNTTLYAVWEDVEYSVTVGVEGVGGTASASRPSATMGTDITLTAVPETEYNFKEWKAITPSDLTITNNTFTMPAANVEIKAVFEEKQQIEKPVITEGGSFSGSKEITITCGTSGVEIYYTLDGTEPSTASAKYSGAFTISNSAIIRAVAVHIDGSMLDSEIAQQVFKLEGDDDFMERIEEFPLTDEVITDELKAAGIESVDEVEETLKQVVASKEDGAYGGNVEIWDVKLQFSLDGGNTWIDATEDNFPTTGITTTLPYPGGTGKDTHDFFVTHMFTLTSTTLGTTAGQTEEPDVTETENGIQVTLKGLSPVAIGYKETAPGGGGDPTPTVTITGVTVSPATANVNKGASQQFTTAVSGTGSYNTAVTWSISGQTSSNTKIDASGLLTIGEDETASAITIKAMAVGDTSKSGTATVTVKSSGGTDPDPGHTHNYGGWQSNSSGHWKSCSCGDTAYHAGHSYGDWVTTKTPTESRDGEKQRTCSVCGYVEKVPLILNPDTGAWEEIPRTGDDSRTELWIALMFLSMGCIFVVLRFRKRGTHEMHK